MKKPATRALDLHSYMVLGGEAASNPRPPLKTLLVNLDAPLRCRCCSEVIASAGSTTAIVDRHAVGIHIARLERSGPGVDGELAGGAAVDSPGPLDLGAR